VKDRIGRERLVHQRIEGPKCGSPEEVLRWMAAIQAQDYAQALWAIGLRMEGGSLAGVEKAIAEGRILRTWALRGTIHFVAAEDAAWMVGLSSHRMIASARRRMAELGLDGATLERSGEIFGSALAGGRRLSRPDMMRLLEEEGIATTEQRGYHILWHHAQRGLICIGPMLGKQQSFALLAEWAPEARHLTREEGFAELARRYFSSRGPALVEDFAHWAGIGQGEARSAIGAAGGSLIKEIIDGREYLGSADPAPGPSRSSRRIQLLPGFDEYLLGYRERGEVLAAEHAPRIAPGGNGIFLPCVVSGGKVVGTWKRAVRKDAVEVSAEGFGPEPLSPQLVRKGAEAYAAFLGLRLA
jgi:hypothetical protein